MRVLITNLHLQNHSGSENVVELLADGLRSAGHQPAVYAPSLGGQADQMRRRGHLVVDRIGQLTATPDIIHGQHLTPCLAAMARFPDVPVVFSCHSAFFEVEVPLPHPQIREVVAVDDSCAARCRERGVPEDRLSVVLNAVDLDRFRRRPPLPETPRKALLLIKNHGHRDMVRSACATTGLVLDELGPASGTTVPDLENRLPDYDLVFATARMALEAAVVGCAVVVCDDRGFAGMLDTGNLAAWRTRNFGVGVLTQPVTLENLHAAIARYDPADAAQVADDLHQSVGQAAYVERFLAIYDRAIGRPAPARDDVAAATAFWAEELGVTLSQRTWQTIVRELAVGPAQDRTAWTALPADALTSLRATVAAVHAKLDGPTLADMQATLADIGAKLDGPEMAQIQAALAGIDAKLDGSLLTDIRAQLADISAKLDSPALADIQARLAGIDSKLNGPELSDMQAQLADIGARLDRPEMAEIQARLTGIDTKLNGPELADMRAQLLDVRAKLDGPLRVQLELAKRLRLLLPKFLRRNA